ncbi:MAG: NUDIX domain-containing protein [Candidatus Woesearchaeota archaeon]|nr:MAG: NUDIX domain-containing protein [Candidatus Woesearchaeota archaeon]
MEVEREFISTVFIVQEGKVLMTWNNKINNWIPVGGHIEPNELPCSSVIREAKEESGLDIELVSPFNNSKTANLIQPAHVHLDHITDNHKHINLIYFAIVKGGKCFKIDDEGKELRWFTKEDLEKEDLAPSIREWASRALDYLGNNTK